MFKPRMTKPESGNPYYNTIAKGGYSGAIVGKPTDAGCNVLANCVGYAAGRFNEIIGAGKFVYFLHPPNAEDFFETGKAAGLKTGSTPKLGAIICWAKGKTWCSTDGAGHVAVVEEIKSDGSIITSESGYGCSNPFWTQHRYKESGNWGQSSAYRFLGFIYQPNEQEESKVEKPAGIIKKEMRGDAVRWLQTKLYEKGFLAKSEIDGDFGNKTLGAVLAFQSANGLLGVVDESTKEKL